MRSLLHVVAGGSESGRDLPEILPALSEKTIKFRQGQFHMVFGLPSSGKTLFTQWYCIARGLRTMYFSFDSDDGTVSNRALAQLTGKTFEQVKEQRQTPAVVELEDTLFELQKTIRFDFSGAATVEAIYEEVEAWQVLFGDLPQVIVIDNLMNLVGGSDSELTGYHDICNALHSLGRDTGAAIIALHHANASLLTAQSKANRIYQDRPAHIGALTNQLSQYPETILSVALDGQKFWVSAVKNRDGIRDMQAENPIAVAVDVARSQFYNTQRDLEVARTRTEWS